MFLEKCDQLYSVKYSAEVKFSEGMISLNISVQMLILKVNILEGRLMLKISENVPIQKEFHYMVKCVDSTSTDDLSTL